LLEVIESKIERAGHATAAVVQNMPVNHCRLHILVATQFIYGPNFLALLQQMVGEKWRSEAVRTARLTAPGMVRWSRRI
jgi:hypothetical protein